jgi:hypothetical protein
MHSVPSGGARSAGPLTASQHKSLETLPVDKIRMTCRAKFPIYQEISYMIEWLLLQEIYMQEICRYRMKGG